MNLYRNIDIKLPKNKYNFKSNAFKEINLSSYITLDDFQSSSKSIVSMSIEPKVKHYKFFLTPSSFNNVNGENIKLSGYKLGVFGVINEVILFENIRYNIKNFNSCIPFYTSITLPTCTDITDPIHIDVFIEDVNVFYIGPNKIFQNIYMLIYVT